MSRRKLVAAFVLRLAIIDALLIMPWSGIPWLYRHAFVTAANVALPRPGANLFMRFTALDAPPPPPALPPENALDVRVDVTNRHSGVRASVLVSSRYYGLFPTAFLLALVVATPVSRRQRCRALLWGLPLLTLVIAASLAIKLAIMLNAQQKFDWETVGGFWHIVLARVDALLSNPLIGWFAIPLAIWMGVMMRRGNLDEIINPISHATADKTASRRSVNQAGQHSTLPASREPHS